jgi:hypothetical protein
VPLPAITLIFPAFTSTSNATVTPVPVSITDAVKPSDEVELTRLSPRIRVLVILLVCLWLLLVGFVIIYIHQLK